LMKQGRISEATEVLNSTLRELESDATADVGAKETARSRLQALRERALPLTK
jgi:hypothetical protein